LAQAAVLALEEAVEAVCHILEEMEAVGDLHRLRRALANALGIGLRPIPAHHFDFRVPTEPGG
jgi:hypothetical protein